MSFPSSRNLLLAILLVGLLARLGFCIVSGFNRPTEAGSDALEMDTYAWNVAQGRGYRGLSPDVTDQDHLTADRPPGTSLVWAGVYKLAGHRYDAVRLLHCALGKFIPISTTGGSLIMTWPSAVIDPLLDVLMSISIVSPKTEIDKHERRLSPTILQEMLRQIGFERFLHRKFELGLNNLRVAYKPK